MAVLQELEVKGSPVSEAATAMIKELLAKQFWIWYAEHSSHKLVTVRIWWISKAVRVRDLYSVFEMLFGPPSPSLPNVLT